MKVASVFVPSESAASFCAPPRKACPNHNRIWDPA